MARARVALPGKEVGTIEILAGDVIPDGYMLCDGTSLLKADYPKLFSKIGVAWGEIDVDEFSLPDLRGKFLRGVDGTAGVDPNKASRTPSAFGGNAGNNVGSMQADATQGHFHSLVFKGVSSTQSNSGTASVETQSVSVANDTNMNSNNQARSMVTNGVNGTPRTSNETRPINANVNYIIKVI
jgi:microcystin-dependent protein